MYVKHFTSVCGINFFMNISISQQVGKNIKEARKFKGITQKEIASVLCMTQQQYSRFETGIYELNYYQILAICEILDILPNDVFDNCIDKSENLILKVKIKA